MEKIFQQIWDEALPYQDKRDDKGHAEITTAYTLKLLETEKGDERIILPAIILHDIGWSQLPKKMLKRLTDSSAPKAELRLIRLAHQDAGVALAKKILTTVKYPKEYISEILEIISQHDTRQGFISNNEGLVRDADKLWRFSKTGIASDLRRFKIPFNQLYDKLIDHRIEEPGYFYSTKAKEIAYREIALRKKEYVK